MRIVRTNPALFVMQVMVVLLLVVMGVSLALGAIQSYSGEAPLVQWVSVTVVPGDSLWTIAKEAVPNVDPREIVWRIRQKNQLESAVLYPGQQLQVPLPIPHDV